MRNLLINFRELPFFKYILSVMKKKLFFVKIRFKDLTSNILYRDNYILIIHRVKSTDPQVKSNLGYKVQARRNNWNFVASTQSTCSLNLLVLTSCLLWID